MEDGRADPTADDNYAIQWSAKKGHDKVVKLLLEDKRADPSADDNYPIRWSAARGHLEVVKLLLNDRRVDPTADDNYAIRWSAQNGKLEVVNVLIASFFINKVLQEVQTSIYLTYDDNTSTWETTSEKSILLTTVSQYFEKLQRTFKNVFQTRGDQQTLPYLLSFSHKQLLDTKKYQKAGKDRERQIRNIAFTYFFMVQYSLIQLKNKKITSIYDNAEKWSFNYTKSLMFELWLPNMGSNYDSQSFLRKELNNLLELKKIINREEDFVEYRKALKKLARSMNIPDNRNNLLETIKAKLYAKPKETQSNLQPPRKKVKSEKTEEKTRGPQMVPDWIDLKLKQRLKF